MQFVTFVALCCLAAGSAAARMPAHEHAPMGDGAADPMAAHREH